jgi:hypothetical protein
VSRIRQEDGRTVKIVIQPGGKIILLILILFGIFAAYLSWTTNELIENIGQRVFYAIGAFFDSITYVMNYYIFKRNVNQS